MNLSNTDLYAVARAVAGEEWQSLSPSPLVRQLLSNVTDQQSSNTLLRWLGADVAKQVVEIDYRNPPRNGHQNEEIEIPDLPADARCQDQALKAAEGAVPFLDEFLVWARKRTPMTPRLFLEAGCIWAISVAIAKRALLTIYKPLAPDLYILWVAESSIFRKTTGMEAISGLVEATMPHLLLPQEMTPEAFIGALSGKQPSNYEHLMPYQKKLIDLGRLYPAQRGILIDEASSMFGARRKDYMQGQEELLMKGFDTSSQPLRKWSISEGWIEIRDFSLSILGGTTPASLIRNINGDDWETGQMARYGLLYPEQREDYALPILSLDEYNPPEHLKRRLAKLYQALPTPPDLLALHDDTPPARPALQVQMAEEAIDRYQLYVWAMSYDLLTNSLDRRLWANYARLPELALKVAISLAAINWADRASQGVPHIGLGEWGRAQQIVESWRCSMHRLLKTLDTGEDTRNENRLLEHLLKHMEGESLLELTQRTGLSRKPVQEALTALIQAGLVQESRRKGNRGPEAIVYVAV